MVEVTPNGEEGTTVFQRVQDTYKRMTMRMAVQSAAMT
jgi:hypothetical protein